MLLVRHADDLGMLEKDAGLLAEHILLVGQFTRQGDRAGLPASYGEELRVLSETHHAAPTTLSGLADVAGDAGHFRVLESGNADRIVGAQKLEGRVQTSDIVSPSRDDPGNQHAKNQCQHR